MQTITACLHSLLDDTDLGVVVEAIDSMFELYSDESRDVVFLELGLLAQCQQTLKDVRAKVCMVARRLLCCAVGVGKGGWVMWPNRSGMGLKPPVPVPAHLSPFFGQVRERAADEEVLDRAGDAVQNLAAFIEYKKEHLPK